MESRTISCSECTEPTLRILWSKLTALRTPSSTTNPRTLLRVAPTILKQSLVACQHGIVDLDSLKDALSYFLQELLSFTLPGVLRWLMGEIERTPSVQGVLLPDVAP